MKLVLSSKCDRKWPKMAKTKIVQKTAYMWHYGLRVNIILKLKTIHGSTHRKKNTKAVLTIATYSKVSSKK